MEPAAHSKAALNAFLSAAQMDAVLKGAAEF
jgi:hypothetical protein